VRKDGDCVEYHPPCHGGYVLSAVRDVGRRDPKPEKALSIQWQIALHVSGVISTTWRSTSYEM
jgi:hypothetical protein